MRECVHENETVHVYTREGANQNQSFIFRVVLNNPCPAKIINDSLMSNEFDDCI